MSTDMCPYTVSQLGTRVSPVLRDAGIMMDDIPGLNELFQPGSLVRIHGVLARKYGALSWRQGGFNRRHHVFWPSYDVSWPRHYISLLANAPCLLAKTPSYCQPFYQLET